MPKEKLSFGRWVATLRKRIGMTQGTLAYKIGLTRQSVTNIEADRQNVHQDYVAQIAEALGVSPTYLIRQEDDCAECAGSGRCASCNPR